MIRYIELIEPFDQNGYTPDSVMASSPNGDWVLYSEAQAELDALKAERDALLADLRAATEVGDQATPADIVGVVKAMWEELRRLQFQASVVDALNDLAYCNGYDHGKKEMSAAYRKDADESIDRQRRNAHAAIAKARGEF